MKRTFVTLLFFVSATSTFAQTNIDYENAISNFKKFYNHQQADSIFDMFSDKIKATIPLDKTVTLVNNLQQQYGIFTSWEFIKEKDIFHFYKAVFHSDSLSLIIALNKENKLETFRFLPYKADSEKVKTGKSNFVLKTAIGNVYGTLTLPDRDKPVPVVLIVPGSGPTDRDGNNNSGMHTNTYLMIADSLQKAGIACVRYDKRGVGESYEDFKVEDNLTFDEMANDATAMAKMLKEDKRFSNVIILGHSEGSLIGMIAANREKVAAFISVAGIAESADKIIVKQIASQSKDLAGKATIILDSLKKGYTVASVDPKLAALFRPSVQPYIRSWLKYDPKDEIKKLKKNVLIIQGTTDLQVDVNQANELKAADPRAMLHIIEGMNHVLKTSTADRKQNTATYSNATLPLNSEFIQTVVHFINEETK